MPYHDDIGDAASGRRMVTWSSQCVQRKDTLLVEYKQLRKANSFVDRRFGGEAAMPCGTPGHTCWKDVVVRWVCSFHGGVLGMQRTMMS